MTAKEFIISKIGDQPDEYWYDLAISGKSHNFVLNLLTEYAYHICAIQRELCDAAVPDLKDNDYAVHDAAYPKI